MATREILEDRWNGAIYECVDGNDWSKLMERLDKTIRDLYETVARQEWTGDMAARPSHPGMDGSGDATGAVHDAIHGALIEGILKAEAARREFPREVQAA